MKTEDLKKLLPTIEKILRTLVFKGSEFDFTVSVYGKDNSTYTSLEISVKIELDKMFRNSPVYDETYTIIAKDLDHTIKDSMKYVNLPHYIVNIRYEYINDSYVKKVCNLIYEEWTQKLTYEYDVPKYIFDDYQFDVTILKDSNYISDIEILALCENTEDYLEFGLDCDIMKKMVNDLFEKYGVTNGDIPYKNGVCDNWYY